MDGNGVAASSKPSKRPRTNSGKKKKKLDDGDDEENEIEEFDLEVAFDELRAARRQHGQGEDDPEHFAWRSLGDKTAMEKKGDVN